MAQTPLEPGHESTPGTPRWVKVFGIIALVLILVTMGMALLRRPALAPPSSSFTLTGFQPVDNPTVRILRGNYDPR